MGRVLTVDSFPNMYVFGRQIPSTLQSCSDRAMVLGKSQFQGVLLIRIRVGPRPAVLSVFAGRGCLGIFLSSIFLFSSFLYLVEGSILTELLIKR